MMARCSVVSCVLALFAGSVPAGCTPAISEPTVGCTTTADCPIGGVCFRSSGTCQSASPSWLVGSFSCNVVDAAGASEIGATDIQGEFGGKRVALLAASFCDAHTDFDDFTLRFTGSYDGSEVMFHASLLASESGGGNHALAPSQSWYQAGTGGLALTDTGADAFFAAPTGVLHLDGAAVIGQPLTGWIEVTLAPGVAEDTPFRVCSTVLDCGPSEPMGCYELAVDAGRTVCSYGCTTSGTELCVAAGGVCDSGLCFLPCSASAPCPAPMQCGDFGGVEYCY